jgi:shikimate kinase
MGSGKSTIGKRVAAGLERPFFDNDEMLERATGYSAAALAQRDGVDRMHHAEADVLLDALRAIDPAVIAAAASTITDDKVRRALGEVSVVWLRADPGTLVERMPGSPTRPFADRDPVGLVEEQAAGRDSLFAGVADATFPTDIDPVESVVAAVMAWLEQT